MPGGLSPALAELAVRFGTALPFGQASALLAMATGTVVSEPTIRRLTEAAGAVWDHLEDGLVAALETAALDPRAAPVAVPDTVPAARGDVLHLSIDGAMIPLVGGVWTEARTLVIGQVTRDATGVRTTALSYASHVTSAAGLSRLALAELTRRGVPGHPAIVSVTDGAVWIQELLDLHCPQAIRVLDFAHAAEYLAQAAQASFGRGTAETSEWFGTQRHELRHGDPDRVLAALAAVPPSAARDTALGYLTTRRPLIAYATFAAAGLPVGSGCVESANKVVIEARLKGAGMHWTRPHADALVALRAVVASDRWDTVWPRIVAALRDERRQRAVQRRQARARPRPDTPVTTMAAPAPPLAPRPPARRPPTIVAGKPTADHPWKRFPACSSTSPAPWITEK